MKGGSSMDRKIFFTQLYRILRNDEQLTIGGIVDGEKRMSFEEDDFEYNIKSLSIDLSSQPTLSQKNLSNVKYNIDSPRMSKELFMSIIEWAEENGIESLTLKWEDLTLFPDIKELMLFIKENFSGNVDIITEQRLS